MSASTDPRTEVARLAPPPPGTVVWSILSWPELLADFGWLDGRWAPLDGRAWPEGALPDATAPASGPSTTSAETVLRRLPDVRGAVLCGGVPAEVASRERLAGIEATVGGDVRRALRTAADVPSGAALASLHAFVIL